MKKLLSLSLSFLLTGLLSSSLAARAQEQAATTAPQETQATATLTNQDVLAMMKTGLSPEVIAAKIKASATKFDTSPTALQELKQAGVSDVVILAMVQAPDGAATTSGVPAASLPAELVDVSVPDGTPVEVELVSTASGQDLKVGDVVDFKVVLPVQVGGITIIDKDAPAKARITRAKKAGHWGRAGKLEWAMQEAVGVDGNRIPLRFTKGTAGDSKGGTVAVGAVATTVLLGPLGLLWGLKTGKPAIIPAGNRYTVFVHGTVGAKGKAVANTTAQTSAQ